MTQTNPKRHKHADLIHAWAEGAEIQFLNAPKQWVDTEGHPAWYEDHQYRIKPRLVKKWKWVFKSPCGQDHYVTQSHYADEEEFYRVSSHHSAYKFVQKVDSTEIEVEW